MVFIPLDHSLPPQTGIHLEIIGSIAFENRSSWSASISTNGRGDLIDILIRYGNNPDGIPPLHYAIKLGDYEAVELLLDHGANVNSRSDRSEHFYGTPNTALDFAAACGNLSIMELLIQRGAKLRSPNPLDRIQTPLCSTHCAVSHDQPDALELLISHGALGKFCDPEEVRHLISEAFRCGSVKILHWFKDEGVDFSKHTIDQESWFQDALEHRHHDCVKFLLDEGVDVNMLFTNNYYPPLNKAASLQDIGLVKMLVEYGANVNLIDANNKSPLQHALESYGLDKLQIVKALLDSGADVNQRNRNFQTPIIMATIRYASGRSNAADSKEIIRSMEYLLLKGADINATDASNKTALAYAKQITPPLTDLINWLIAHGARS